MKEKLYIVGTGEHSRKVYHCARLSGYEIVAFVAEREDTSPPIPGLAVISESVFMMLEEPGRLFVAIGDGKTRQIITERYKKRGWIIPALVHPGAIVAPDAKLESGALLAAGVVIESGCKIGTGSIVDIGVLLDHDCRIPPYSHLKAKCSYSHESFPE